MDENMKVGAMEESVTVSGQSPVVDMTSERGRSDDQAWIIKERLAVYSRETEPVLAYYRRRRAVTILDGNRPVDEVTEAIETEVRRKTELGIGDSGFDQPG